MPLCSAMPPALPNIHPGTKHLFPGRPQPSRLLKCLQGKLHPVNNSAVAHTPPDPFCFLHSRGSELNLPSWLDNAPPTCLSLSFAWPVTKCHPLGRWKLVTPFISYAHDIKRLGCQQSHRRAGGLIK